MKIFAMLLFVLAAACGGSKSTPKTPEKPPADAAVAVDAPAAAATFKPGPNGVPLPLDASDGEAAPGGGGAITVYKVPRGKNEVADELRTNFKAEGWEIVNEEISPRGAIRIEVKKDTTSMMARLTGDETQAALIIQTK